MAQRLEPARLRDQLPPELQEWYDAKIAEWQSGRDKGEPDDLEAIERDLGELRAQVEGS